MTDSTAASRIVTADLGSGRWLVSLIGEHDLSTAPELRRELEAVFRTGTAVMIDLGETSFLDSSILSVLFQADALAQRGRCRQFGLVVAPDTAPDRLLDVTGAKRAFTIFGTVEDAIAYSDLFDSVASEGPAGRWGERTRRIVKNEQAFRDYNNRRMQSEPVGETDDEELIPFVCECGDAGCIEALLITAQRFTEAHSAPNRFVVKPGHVYPDVEHVIAEYHNCCIVEKYVSAVREATS